MNDLYLYEKPYNGYSFLFLTVYIVSVKVSLKRTSFSDNHRLGL